jgi:hypothetical protein
MLGVVRDSFGALDRGGIAARGAYALPGGFWRRKFGRDSMSWFEMITGFGESSYDETRARLAVDGQWLSSRENKCRYRLGQLELTSLRELRERVRQGSPLEGTLTVRNVTGDVGQAR